MARRIFGLHFLLVDPLWLFKLEPQAKYFLQRGVGGTLHKGYLSGQKNTPLWKHREICRKIPFRTKGVQNGTNPFLHLKVLYFAEGRCSKQGENGCSRVFGGCLGLKLVVVSGPTLIAGALLLKLQLEG